MSINQNENNQAIKSPIIVFAEKTYHKFYRNLVIRGETIKVFSCEESTQVLKNANPDIVLIDCGFYIKRGLKLLTKIKRDYPGVPIFFLTDKSTEESIIEAFRRGARDYFRKPVRIRELKDKIENLLKMKRNKKEKRTPYIMSQTKSTGDEKLSINSSKPINILRSIDFMEENLIESINLDSCAKAARLSKYHFCRLFKKSIGMSPMKFVMFLRINRAKELLKKDDLNILEVALAIGISEPNRFIRCFKEFIGCTPSEYRKTKLAK